MKKRLAGAAGVIAVGVAATVAYLSTTSGPPTIVAVGDIAIQGGSQAKTAALVGSPTAVLVLGDNEYPQGSLADYRSYYDKSWGQFKPETKPVPGNHEYYTTGATGYKSYFGLSQTWYSYNLGSWHLIALDSECGPVPGGCYGPEYTWLKADLASNTKPCLLAYWHEPRWSVGTHYNETIYDGWWRRLYSYRADVVLNGHDHEYERWKPLKPDGSVSSSGIHEFVVGTGGKNLSRFARSDSRVAYRENTHFGVLKMTLSSSSYSWKFVAVGGATLDQGTASCY